MQTTTKIKVAFDSGAVKHVIHPKTLPSNIKITPNHSGQHFSGANGAEIEKFGWCTTKLSGKRGDVKCDWSLADVNRPLHSVTQIAGSIEGLGKNDVLFNNRRGVVVPPGVVDAIMQHIDAIAEYPREGNLYVAEMTMSDFVRPDLSN